MTDQKPKPKPKPAALVAPIVADEPLAIPTAARVYQNLMLCRARALEAARQCEMVANMVARKHPVRTTVPAPPEQAS